MMQRNRNSMWLKKELIRAFFVLTLATMASASQGRTKRMYALCPPHFQRIGSECYFISSIRVNWLDAHFECKDRNSRLAEPYKLEDRMLRKYMQRADKSRTDFWIGGIYNWQRNKWQWGYNGRDMTYQSFSQMASANTQDLKFHCAILNPHLKYRWSARSCVDKHNFICQHRMPYVDERNRQRVYIKWNETYPNEMANEIEEVINEGDRTRRRGHRRPFNRNRQRNINERNRHANSIQTRLDDRLENRVDFPRPVHNPPVRRRQNRHRLATVRNHRNDVLNDAFEPHYNRTRFYTPRKRIDFGENAEARLLRRQHHQKIRRNRLRTSTTSTTTTTTTTTTRPTTTTEAIQTTMPPIPAFVPITTTEYVGIDERYRAELDEERARQEEDEAQRYAARRREQEENMNALMKQEERRIWEENERRAKHLKEMEEREKRLKEEQQKIDEIERLRQEKQRQNEERKWQNEQNQIYAEEEARKLAELKRQREIEAQRNAMTTLAPTLPPTLSPTLPSTFPPLLSNDVIESTTTVRVQPKKPVRKLTPEEKQKKLDALRKRIKNLSPEAQQAYLEKRFEKNRKRGILAKAIDDSQRTK